MTDYLLIGGPGHGQIIGADDSPSITHEGKVYQTQRFIMDATPFDIAVCGNASAETIQTAIDEFIVRPSMRKAFTIPVDQE